jgi:hypothetical protein
VNIKRCLPVLLLIGSLAFAQEVKLPAPRQEAVDAAIALRLTQHTRKAKGGAHTNQGANGGAPIILAAAAYAGNDKADARLLEQIRFSITGGNDITANGGYPAQHERYITGMLAIAARTPRVWDQLTGEEKAKVDLVQKAALVASAFVTSDNNPFIAANSKQVAIDGDTNLNRGWNPNFREGMAGGLICGVVYFGTPDKATEFLKKYDHAKFVAELERAGLTNIHETFTWKASNPPSGAPTGEQIEKAVRHFRYNNAGLEDPMGIYWALTDNTFGAEVSCGLNDGKGTPLPDGTAAGYYLGDCEKLPNKGKLGMLKEFDSFDANGKRSSTLYSYDGFRCNIVNQYLIRVGGYWKDGPVANQCRERFAIGATDLWLKIDNGYSNYAKGKKQGDLKADATHHGLQFIRPLWDDIIQPLMAEK